MLSPLRTTARTEIARYSPELDPLDQTIDLNLGLPTFYVREDSSNQSLKSKSISSETSDVYFPVSRYIQKHFTKDSLPPLHKDPVFDDTIRPHPLEHEKPEPPEIIYTGQEIRPATKFLASILDESKHRLQRISIGTQLSKIDDITYEKINRKLNSLKALVNANSALQTKTPNLDRYKITLEGKKLIQQTEDIQFLIKQKLSTGSNEDLKDLNKELETLKKLCFQPLTLR